MKRLLFILLFYSCSKNDNTKAYEKETMRIDSLSKYMDLMIFKIEEPKMCPEFSCLAFDRYTIYFNADFPQYAKYESHRHTLPFVDSVFYYLNDRLIKFTASENHKSTLKRSITCYFKDSRLIDPINQVDAISINAILKNADLYLSRGKELIK